jgi:hypothetical protein
MCVQLKHQMTVAALACCRVLSYNHVRVTCCALCNGWALLLAAGTSLYRQFSFLLETFSTFVIQAVELCKRQSTSKQQNQLAILTAGGHYSLQEVEGRLAGYPHHCLRTPARSC